MLLGLLTPEHGTIRVLGQAPGAKVRARVGYLPEERGLYKRMRADAAIAYIAALKGMEMGAAHARATALLEEYGLGANAKSRIESLSKGMAQKVALLTALAHDPELLILDEPFSGLDPINQQSFEDSIRSLARAGKTILFSTHTMAQAERLCDHLVIMAHGAKVFDGTLEQARSRLPRRAHIAGEGDLSFLRDVAGVASVSPPLADQTLWTLELHKGANSSALLAACLNGASRLPISMWLMPVCRMCLSRWPGWMQMKRPQHEAHISGGAARIHQICDTARLYHRRVSDPGVDCIGGHRSAMD